ncbi:GEVED domain-containing protein [Hymenobacter sp.]|uniref:GEVED domain-containing protein n=1 Tax=Hymenobacter sp. TaxID=1898978 RepID=UPI00286A1A03|nr:GEVED domain-containing protein [Hymenobacter sp.]
MNPLLLCWARVAPGVGAVLVALGAASAVSAQGTNCPAPATCTPGAASNPQAGAFAMGIFNVTLGNNLINRTSAGQSEGYQDNSCTLTAALAVGQSYAVSVRTNPNTAENVRVWIDYNNDGAFTANNELVFSSNNSILHTGTITPPATATLGARLRLRVAADYGLGVVPMACSTPQYSQVEDYGVTLAANVSAPVAGFTTNATTTCTGCVQFTDASQNLPTAWLWTFGDGTTSPLQSPSHCYATAGTFAVTLRATNATGANTSAATSIVYNSAVPAAASCAPPTINYFANYGIVRFRLNTIDNASANGSAGYQDFTCPQRTELIAGVNYPMTITTGGTSAHDIRVYLDRNNDGTLTPAEQVYQGLNVASPGATVTLNLPAGTVLNQPLRLRAVADAVGSPAGPCVSPASGQAEDYTVVARPNTQPPAVNFSSNYVPGGCVNPIQFTDLTTNLPTAWLWNFGDGGTSTLQNPAHQYAASGTYNVSLSATNANGTASITPPDAVTITVPCLSYCASNGTGGTGPGGVPQPSQFFIATMSVPNAQPAFSNSSANTAAGYTSYTAQSIGVSPGSLVNISVVANRAVAHLTGVWVDWNRNGVFDAPELVSAGFTPNGPNATTYAASFAVPPGASGSTRMRVTVVANSNFLSPCGVNVFNAEVEDYQLQVLPLATRDALALPALSLFPNPTPDGRLRLRLPEAKAAGVYGAEVQNLLGATVLRAALRLGPAADAELDLRGLAPGVYVLRLRDARGLTATRRVVRE